PQLLGDGVRERLSEVGVRDVAVGGDIAGNVDVPQHRVDVKGHHHDRPPAVTTSFVLASGTAPLPLSSLPSAPSGSGGSRQPLGSLAPRPSTPLMRSLSLSASGRRPKAFTIDPPNSMTL